MRKPVKQSITANVRNMSTVVDSNELADVTSEHQESPMTMKENVDILITHPSKECLSPQIEIIDHTPLPTHETNPT